MNINRTTLEKFFIALYTVIIILGVISIAIDISQSTNTAVGILFLAGAAFLYFKVNDKKTQEEADSRTNELIRAKTCLYHAHNFTKFTGECISSVELPDFSTVRITFYDRFVAEIEVDYFANLKSPSDFEKLDHCAAQYIDDHHRRKLPESSIKISLEISLKNFLEKLK